MKIFNSIPVTAPNTPLLDKVNGPADLKKLAIDELPAFADELREYLLYSVGQSGGHFGSGLGVVELTVALHYVFDAPNDALCWDVGHQAYPHKILTGRKESITSIRKEGGLAAFPNRDESPFDAFGVGHSSTSISAALGYATSYKLQNKDHKAVAIIGDGALTAGMAFEALNHAGHDQSNMLVVLNDNDMAISENVGGLSKALARIISSKAYSSVRQNSKNILKNIPPALEFAKRAEEHMKGMLGPGTLFEELGFNFIGPVDGHNVIDLVRALSNIKTFDGPQFLHVATKKGKGFEPAEAAPIKYHAINKIQPQNAPAPTSAPSGPKYSNVFGDWICDTASIDKNLVGITPAMAEGSDLVEFSKKFPERYFDVAIAEQHAVTFAAGLACAGMKPVVAIYSTFLQRGYDQLIHDVALQNLDVTFAIDRAGLVGEDGPTHAGSFDLGFLRMIPNLIVMAPKDENETRQMLTTAYHYSGPSAVRYPRGTGPNAPIDKELVKLPLGKAEIIQKVKTSDKPAKVAILAWGSMVETCKQVAEDINATLVNMRFIKPIDEAMIIKMAEYHDLIVTVEENAIMGGAGSAVNEYLAKVGITKATLNLGLPDMYLEHGKPAKMLSDVGLDSEGIKNSILNRLS